MASAIFADSSALFALLDQSDEQHATAAREWAQLLDTGTSLITTNYVLTESFALVQRRLGMGAARTLHDDLIPSLVVHWVTREEHARGTEAMLLAKRRKLSLVDCVSFAVMRSLNIQKAFHFDAHFREQGY